MEEILTVEAISKSYREIKALEEVSFSLKEAEIVGLLGPNGAGKTTTINIILGILTPDRGRVMIKGIEVSKKRSLALSLTNFSAFYTPLPGNLTVEENLYVFGLLYAVKGLPFEMKRLIREFELEPLRKKRCGLLSSGEQMRLGIAKALLNRPKLLLLDEPTASLDPVNAQKIRLKLKSFAQQTGASILWTSHNMYEIEEVCNRLLFISKGRIILEGRPEALIQEYGKENLEELFLSLAHEKTFSLEKV